MKNWQKFSILLLFLFLFLQLFFYLQNNDRLDQSPSEYFPIVTDIVTLDNAHLHSEDIDEKADAEVQAAANDNAIARINTSKGNVSYN